MGLLPQSDSFHSNDRSSNVHSVLHMSIQRLCHTSMDASVHGCWVSDPCPQASGLRICVINKIKQEWKSTPHQTQRGISTGFLKGIYKGSIKGLGFGSFRKLGVPYFGVLIIRILLFRIPG